jgi:hypothetical protein
LQGFREGYCILHILHIAYCILHIAHFNHLMCFMLNFFFQTL